MKALAEAEASCTRCPLYRDATQAVPGEGPARASVMLVGEQPGDKEDLAGKPFVGPAGRLLDRHSPDAGFAEQRRNDEVQLFAGSGVGRGVALTTPACVSAFAICCMRLMSSTAAAGGSTRRQAG